MDNDIFEPFLTSYEIGVLTETPHEVVLERTCEAFLAININPNLYWYDQTLPKRKVLRLTQPLTMIALANGLYSNKARTAAIEVFTTWARHG